MADLESTVWMIHAGTSRDGVKGLLTVDDMGVRFQPIQGGPTSETLFTFARIRRARRVMGSPVLELSLDPDAGPGPRVIGFYFVQPPSLEAQADSGPLGRRRLRRDAAVALFRWNSVKRNEVSRWVEKIRQAKRRT